MKKILIIEDDPAISMGLQDSLIEEHYEVMSEDDGERGFKKAMKDVLIRIQAVGFKIVRTTFKGKRYYIPATQGKDPNLSPSDYGLLALILAYFQEFGQVLSLDDVLDTFREFETAIEDLAEKGYLLIESSSDENVKIIRPQPIFKVIFKDFLPSLNINFISELSL